MLCGSIVFHCGPRSGVSRGPLLSLFIFSAASSVTAMWFSQRDSRFTIFDTRFALHDIPYTIRATRFTLNVFRYTIIAFRFLLHDYGYTIIAFGFLLHNSYYTILATSLSLLLTLLSTPHPL